jgi:uncharacterized membrane protein YphA (DoxX/SURF4 family)
MIRALSRVALAWVFVHAGVDVLQHPEVRAKTAAPLLEKARSASPVAVPDDVNLVRANAAAQCVAGAALGLGILPRVAAAVLIGSLVPTTIGGHRFWEIEDPTARAAQRIHAEKNLAMAGGLLAVLASPRRRREEQSA